MSPIILDLGYIEMFLRPLALALLKSGGQLIVMAAREAIIATVNDPSLVSNDQKRAAAVAIVGTKLAAEGIPIVKSNINAAIEAAYTEWKELNARPPSWADLERGGNG
jgi:hypothetical protein